MVLADLDESLRFPAESATFPASAVVVVRISLFWGVVRDAVHRFALGGEIRWGPADAHGMEIFKLGQWPTVLQQVSDEAMILVDPSVIKNILNAAAIRK